MPWQDATAIAVLLGLGAVLCVWQARNHARRQGDLARVSRTDPLTGVLNRPGLRERLAGELSAADRTARPLAFVLVDLPAFAALNEDRGHDAGDQAGQKRRPDREQQDRRIEGDPIEAENRHRRDCAERVDRERRDTDSENAARSRQDQALDDQRPDDSGAAGP